MLPSSLRHTPLLLLLHAHPFYYSADTTAVPNAHHHTSIAAGMLILSSTTHSAVATTARSYPLFDTLSCYCMLISSLRHTPLAVTTATRSYPLHCCMLFLSPRHTPLLLLYSLLQSSHVAPTGGGSFAVVLGAASMSSSPAGSYRGQVHMSADLPSPSVLPPPASA